MLLRLRGGTKLQGLTESLWAQSSGTLNAALRLVGKTHPNVVEFTQKTQRSAANVSDPLKAEFKAKYRYIYVYIYIYTQPMNSNFWISSINSNQEDRETFAIRTLLRHFQGIIQFFANDIVITSDSNFVNANNDQQNIQNHTTG